MAKEPGVSDEMQKAIFISAQNPNLLVGPGEIFSIFSLLLNEQRKREREGHSGSLLCFVEVFV